MRNLKKVLSLALAMVMLLGMMVVGAGATEFKDASDIKNTEAVAVVSGIGVLQGDENGSFNPEGTLSRAEAAVVIAKLDLGAAFGNLATTNASTFKDVGAGYGWAKPYIDYCAARGLIAGDGNGYFMPDQKVTGVQFALMVCRVLGYEDANEEIGGANWEVNAAALARKAGLTVDVTLGTNAITRDDMAQVAYNALTADMVEYKQSAITIGDITIPAGKASAVEGAKKNNSDYRTSDTDDNTRQLCEEKFAGLKLKSGTDDFNRPANVWEYNKDDIATIAKESSFTFTAATKASDITKTLKGYKVLDNAGTPNEKAITDKNFTSAAIKTVNGGTAAGIAVGSATDDSFANEIAKLTGNGVLVEIYADDDKEITDISVVETTLMQVTRINATAKTVTLSRVSDAGVTNTITVDEEGAFYAALSDMDVDSYVLITASNDSGDWTIQSVTEPETVTGAVTKVTSSKKLTVDGTEYSTAKVFTSLPAVDSKKDVVLFLDNYGYAIYSTAAEAATSMDVVYVTAIYNGTGTWGATKLFQGVLTDGTAITGEYKTASGTSITGTGSDSDEVFKAYTYTMDGDTYVLSDAAASETAIKSGDGMGTTAIASAIAAGAKKTTNFYYASDVNFIYVNGKKGNLVTSVKEGVQAVDAGSNNYIVVSKDGLKNSVVTTVFVNGLASTASDDLVYVAEDMTSSNYSSTTTGPDGKRLYSYDVYINGKEKTVEFSSTQTHTAGFYTYSVNDETGVYTLTSTSSGVITGDTISQVDKLSNDLYYLTVDSDTTANEFNAAKAFVVDTRGNPNPKITDLDSLKDVTNPVGGGGSAVDVAIAYNSDDKVVVGVYVVEAPPAPSTDATLDGTEFTVSNCTFTVDVTNSLLIVYGTAMNTCTINGANGVPTNTVTMRNNATALVYSAYTDASTNTLKGAAALVNGDKIVVTAEDGTTTKVYTVQIGRGNKPLANTDFAAVTDVTFTVTETVVGTAGAYTLTLGGTNKAACTISKANGVLNDNAITLPAGATALVYSTWDATTPNNRVLKSAGALAANDVIVVTAENSDVYTYTVAIAA